MSHYSVAVIHSKDQRIDDLLAPYDENVSVEPYIEYTKAEAIAYYREHVKAAKDVSDENCWKAMAEGHKTDDDGNIYSTYNPKSKWDWYEVGGRFDDVLHTKDGKKVTEARIGDIKTELDPTEYEDAKDLYEVVVDCTKEPTPGKDYFTLYKPEYFKEYYGSADYYAKCRASFTTYAVITPDGEWHAQGDMGWFGCSSATPDEARDWNDHYKERFIDSQDEDLILTIVDCHI